MAAKTPSPADLAALSQEAGEILVRIAADPENAAVIRQHAERLSHLEQRIGKEAFASIVDKIKAALAPAASA